MHLHTPEFPQKGLLISLQAESMANENLNNITSLSVQLLSAFVSKNSVPSESLAKLIRSTRAALAENVVQGGKRSEPEFTPAVSVRTSLASQDHILSLIDGTPYKTLKRHLTSHGLNEQNYRERYNLPASYPMVAPSYSETRRAVAQKLGLGKRSGISAHRTPAAVENAAAQKSPKTAKAAQPKAAAARPARKKLSIAAPRAEERSSTADVPAQRKTFKAALNAAANHLNSTPETGER